MNENFEALQEVTIARDYDSLAECKEYKAVRKDIAGLIGVQPKRVHINVRFKQITISLNKNRYVILDKSDLESLLEYCGEDNYHVWSPTRCKLCIGFGEDIIPFKGGVIRG